MSTQMPRDCTKLREQLPEYADGTLAGRARARLEEHLQTCQRCAAELEDLRAVIGALRSVAPDEVPEGLGARVAQGVRELAPPIQGLPQLWARVAIPAALIVAIVAVSFALFAPSRRSAVAPGAGHLRVASRPAPESALDSLGEVPPPAPSISEPALSGAFRAEAEVDTFAAPEAISRASDEVTKAKELTAAREPSGAPYARAGRAGGQPAGARYRPSSPVTAREEMPCLRICEGMAEDRAERGDYSGGALGGGRKAEKPAPPPISANAALLREDGRPVISLQLGAEGDSGKVTVFLEREGSRQQVWEGVSPTSVQVSLSADQIGPGPAALPLAIESAQARRDYVLFIPMLARLGESAPNAPMGSYHGEPLSAVLAEFSALTGLVLLAEEPLSMQLEGEIPPGSPEVSVQQIAADAGLEVQQSSDVVLNLTHRR
jgi:hypothetical protein